MEFLKLWKLPLGRSIYMESFERDLMTRNYKILVFESHQRYKEKTFIPIVVIIGSYQL
jgi:hypothetical protein